MIINTMSNPLPTVIKRKLDVTQKCIHTNIELAS